VEAAGRHSNRLKSLNVSFVIAAVGASCQDGVEFFESVNEDDPSTGSSVFREKTVHFVDSVSVLKPVYTVDVLMQGLPAVQFMKIDVQGYVGTCSTSRKHL
jgi:hypothetical protein